MGRDGQGVTEMVSAGLHGVLKWYWRYRAHDASLEPEME